MDREHDAGRWNTDLHGRFGSRKEICIGRLTRELFALFVASALAVHAQDYKKTVIYQVVTDRFYDGSTSNDNPSQSAGLYDANGFAEDGSGDTTAMTSAGNT